MENKQAIGKNDCFQEWAEADLKLLVVRPIRACEEREWDRLMSAHHYLGLKQLVGESLKYVAELEGRWVALLGCIFRLNSTTDSSGNRPAIPIQIDH